ncbi:MAG TPA: hypothetical protein VGD45_15690 [Steroidobacter sp.]|uniref:hypothetical protein n=1 Tax=Steroidobacter sp. TaxID=1978227 RepID=UPI002EDB5174
MATLDPKDARNYLARWELVHKVEVAQLRETSMETKARQLAVLMASRELFAKDQKRDQEIADVRARWAKIRSALSG